MSGEGTLAGSSLLLVLRGEWKPSSASLVFLSVAKAKASSFLPPVQQPRPSLSGSGPAVPPNLGDSFWAPFPMVWDSLYPVFSSCCGLVALGKRVIPSPSLPPSNPSLNWEWP